MNISYKTSTNLDVENIYKLSKNLIDTYEDIENIEYEKVLRWIYKKIEKNIYEYTSIYLDNQLVGYYHFSEVDNKMELDDFYIFANYRNKGIGSIVLEKLTQTNKTVFLCVFVKNVDAIRLYERFGFNIIENIKNTRYIMER